MKTIGLIGLGNAGAALARPLAAAYDTVGYDIDADRYRVVAPLGVRCLDSVDAVARAADLVLLNLPQPDLSLAVAEQVLNAGAPPRLLIETSTVTPATARALAQRCETRGVAFLDAAIAGGVAGMAAGTTTFLVGGSEADLQAARPVLESMASTVRHIGPVGAGMGAKVVINAVYHAQMVVLLEALAMTRKLDIPAETLIDILKGPEGLLRPLTHRLEERVLNDDFDGGMSVDNARKDSLLALRTAQDLGVPLYAIQAAHTPYEIAAAQGLGDQDYASLVKLWRDWCRLC